MLNAMKPGQSIRCTVTKDIRVDDDYSTVMRLMRFDPAVKRKLKSAQEHRVRTLVIVSRGKRPWECREKSAQQVQAVKGATWTMRWMPHVEKDFACVEKYLKVEAA
jgi:hypothetical protein